MNQQALVVNSYLSGRTLWYWFGTFLKISVLKNPINHILGVFCLAFFVFGVFCLFVFSFVGFIFQRGEFSEAKPYKFSLVNMQHIK